MTEHKTAVRNPIRYLFVKKHYFLGKLNYIFILKRYQVWDKIQETRKTTGKDEGLNTLKYQVVEIEKTNLFTRFYVNYNQKQMLEQFRIVA